MVSAGTGGFYAIGRTYGHLGSIDPRERAKLLRFDQAGDTLWTKEYVVGCGVRFYSIVKTDSDQLAILATVCEPLDSIFKLIIAFIDNEGDLIDTVALHPLPYAHTRINVPFHYFSGAGFVLADQCLSGFCLAMTDQDGRNARRGTPGQLPAPGTWWIDGLNSYVPSSAMAGYIAVDVMGWNTTVSEDRLAVGFLRHSDTVITWAKTYGSDDPDRWDRSSSIIRTSDENLLIVATWNFRQHFSFNTDADFWLIKVDTSGNVLWERRYGDNQYQELYNVIETSDGGLLMNGIYAPRGSGPGGADYYLIKVDKDGLMTHINGQPVTAPILTATPNPAREQLQLTWQLQTGQPDRVVLTDLTGRAMKHIGAEPTRNYLEVNVTGLAPGIYLCGLWSGNTQLAVTKVVVQ